MARYLLIYSPGLVATCAPHWSVWLRGGGGTSTAWHGVSKDCSHLGSGSRRRRSFLRLRTPPFYKPQAKGGGEDRKAMRCIPNPAPLLSHSGPSHAPPETGSDAYRLRHGSELLTYHGGMLPEPAPRPRTCTECRLDVGWQRTFSATHELFCKV